MKRFHLCSFPVLATALVLTGCFKDPVIPPLQIPDLQIDSLTVLPATIPAADYTDVYFTDAKTGYAVSVSGEAIKTTDSGFHWQPMQLPVQAYLHRIIFVSAGKGFIIGGADTIPSGFILKTTDEGISWQRISLNTPFPGHPSAIYFMNESTGFVAGKNYFKKTTDGGNTWTSVTGIPAEDFTDIKFIDQFKGYLTTKSGKYYKTTDGGNSWQALQLNTTSPLGEMVPAFTKMYVLVGNNLLADLESGAITNTFPPGASRLLFLSATHAVAVGQHYESGFWPYGDIYLSSDLWHTIKSRRFEPRQAINFRAAAKAGEHSVMMLGNGLLQTTVVQLRY